MTLNTTTTIKDHLYGLRECIIDQLKNNIKGELEILHQTIHELCKITSSTYGFIGLIDQDLEKLNYSNLIECTSFQNNIPILGNGPLNTSSIAVKYLKLAHGKQLPFFSYDEDKYRTQASWFSFLLIPIFHQNQQIGLIGLCDKREGYSKNLLRSINLCSTAIYHVMLQQMEKVDMMKAFDLTPPSRFFCDKTIYDIMSTIDENGTIVLSNIMWNECFGCKKNQILQMIMHQDHHLFFKLMEDAQRSGFTESAIVRMIKNNKILYLNMRVINLRKQNQIQIIAQDVSERYTKKAKIKLL
ncbi:hypothetical protein KMW28_07275 [Flammeovirga yaeyamensis]|uniref:GAF domain-containing protein n=1 Tax=Flammeovirga yaeyamensis TaxID=367791 RepID=A0AAX1NBI1_9BACT|nr:hypothetical protein [Flammeovirga yaeyamensis]MBB3697981.1 hypothetical protein [Flammeovirga yaeyamensis]NMF35667.1 hypothetical protein [Flammeovirga yaeyamensis]QWG03378.1 hypothetical protein KMW28_07275 [Flammeovirga yaeyamensis]